jgi:serine O-acetyltransferase
MQWEFPMREVLRLIRSDVRAKALWAYEADDVRAQLKALASDGTAAMVLYRLMQGSRRARLPVLEMVFNKLTAIFGGCIIGRGAEFGPGLVLVHSQGVVINGAVRGGRDIKIEHQVTIGAEKRLSPVIGDGVFIGAGAKIVGPVTIGANARIGANAVVVHDVPPDTTAVGIPARAIPRRDRAGAGGGEGPPRARNAGAGEDAA